MAELIFNTTEGQTVARETLVLFLNTGTASAPTWAPVGVRVTSSSAEYDWQRDTSQDILGNAYSEMKKPIITQSFDPWPMSNGDSALLKLWNTGIKDQDAQAMAAQDMLVVHKYAGTKETAVFAERYAACAVEINSIGGEGGGSLGMPITVTYGGTRTVGSAKALDGVVEFTPDSDL